MFKVTYEVTGGDPLKMVASIQAALQKAVPQAMATFADGMTQETLKDVRRRVARVTDKVADETDALGDKGFEDALWEYVRAIDSSVRRTPGRIDVQIGVEDRVTMSGWNLPYLLRLLEYGGAAYVGGKTIPLPPHPHWRPAAQAVLRTAARLDLVAQKQVLTAILNRLKSDGFETNSGQSGVP